MAGMNVVRRPVLAGGIRFAAEGIDERLLVCNGDVLTDLDLAALVFKKLKRRPMVMPVVVEV